MTIAETNAAMMKAIKQSGNSYYVRKYAGAWVPVIVVDGKRQSLNHCSTSWGAMDTAIKECAKHST